MSGDGGGSTLAEEGYEELRMIGRGNYGSAHLVRRTSDKRHYVAKKVALACLSAKEREGAYQEVDLLKKLQHPFIVEYQQTLMLRGDILVIIMQYCEGGDMASYIKQTAKDGRFFRRRDYHELVRPDPSCFGLYSFAKGVAPRSKDIQYFSYQEGLDCEDR
mmetsp:Transcript_103850/g.237758  ORF Transcript_103850/g.237758 Transcript_103850/m.237758 type:complete len:161 (+) Transcript_103850:139-621(+)